KEDVLKGRTNMLSNAFEPDQVLFLEGLRPVQEKDSAGWLATLVKRHGQQGANPEFQQNGTGQPGQVLNWPAVAAVPSKTRTLVNLHGGVDSREKLDL